MTTATTASLLNQDSMLLRLQIIGYENPSATNEHDRAWIRVLCTTEHYPYALDISVTATDLHHLSEFLTTPFAEDERFFSFTECGLELQVCAPAAGTLACVARVTASNDMHFEFSEQVRPAELAEFKRQLDRAIASL